MGHTQRLGRLAFHPAGAHVGTASYDGTWRLWDVETAAMLVEQEGHSRSVYIVAFQADGSLAASGSLDAYGAHSCTSMLQQSCRGVAAWFYSGSMPPPTICHPSTLCKSGTPMLGSELCLGANCGQSAPLAIDMWSLQLKLPRQRYAHDKGAVSLHGSNEHIASPLNSPGEQCSMYWQQTYAPLQSVHDLEGRWPFRSLIAPVHGRAALGPAHGAQHHGIGGSRGRCAVR